MIRDLVLQNRTHRRFDESAAISRPTLESLVDLARLSASGGNKQPLKFILSCDPATNARIFPSLAWAGYLKDWGGPKEGERPAAYIVILLDKDISADAGCDHGIAAQSIMLGATELGLRGCMVGAIRRKELREALKLPDRYDILLVLALGKPGETVIVEAVKPDDDIKYWRDAQDRHHVPKRSLQDLIIG